MVGLIDDIIVTVTDEAFKIFTGQLLEPHLLILFEDASAARRFKLEAEAGVLMIVVQDQKVGLASGVALLVPSSRFQTDFWNSPSPGAILARG